MTLDMPIQPLCRLALIKVDWKCPPQQFNKIPFIASAVNAILRYPYCVSSMYPALSENLGQVEEDLALKNNDSIKIDSFVHLTLSIHAQVVFRSQNASSMLLQTEI